MALSPSIIKYNNSFLLRKFITLFYEYNRLYSLLAHQREKPGYKLFRLIDHLPLITLLSDNQRANEREVSIIDGPYNYVNFPIYILLLLILFLS